MFVEFLVLKNFLLNIFLGDFLYIFDLIFQYLYIIFFFYFIYIKYMCNEFFYMFLFNVDMQVMSYFGECFIKVFMDVFIGELYGIWVFFQIYVVRGN